MTREQGGARKGSELLQNWQTIVEMARHDPAAVAGFLLIGASSVLFFPIAMKLSRAGHSISANGLGVPFTYLKVRAKHDWTPWPAYLSWLCLIAGVALLVFGAFHLSG